MHGELVRIAATDGVELVGFYAAPKGGVARRAVLHTHGLAGNFYENRFVSRVCEAVVAKGLAFLTFNNRGHDFLATNFKDTAGGTEVVWGGSAWEVFDECVHDLAGCARFLRERGHDKIYYEGHSLGTVKIVYYLASGGETSAAGAVLLSPPDMYGLQIERMEGEAQFNEARRKAIEAVDSGRGDEEIAGTGFQTAVTATAYASVFGEPAKTDVFPFRLGSAGDYTRLASIDVPMLVVFGTVEEAVTVPVERALELVKENARSAPRVEVASIAGSPHEYLGYEDEVARLVADFVRA